MRIRFKLCLDDSNINFSNDHMEDEPIFRFPQVDSLSVNPSPEGLPELMVSQPGCGYAILTCSWTQEGASGPEDENAGNSSR